MNNVIYIVDRLHDVVFNLLMLIVAPILIVVLLTRKLVVDIKNKIIILNDSYKGKNNE
jgi:hypothetical protein